jgi:hypothetical protein
MVQLGAGIYLIHALLIICLAAVALSASDSTNLQRRSSV